MGVGIEDVVAIKSLETGLVPPVANIKARASEVGVLNLSRGGAYPVQYALRLGAGFGSQISMSLLRWVPSPDGERPSPDALGYAYRVDDPMAWKGLLARAAGDPAAAVEVVHRTLRVVGRTAKIVEKVIAAPEIAPVVKREEPAPVSAPPPVPVQNDGVRERVLALIAEKTGYPPEMLDLDLDLEADLGVDTVKQAEVFAAIREVYSIPRDENLKLRDFPTLAHTIQFVYDRRPDLKGSPAAAPVEIESPAPAAVPAVEIPRRVPLPVLRPPLALCKETGVKLGPGGRVAVALDQGGVGEELVRRLRERGAEVIILDEAAEVAGPIQGIYWLPALDREADLSAMSAAAWREANQIRVKRLSMALRALYEAIGKPGTFLV